MHVTSPLIRLTGLISRNGFDLRIALPFWYTVAGGYWLVGGRYLDVSAAVSDNEIEADHASFWNPDATCVGADEDACTTTD